MGYVFVVLVVSEITSDTRKGSSIQYICKVFRKTNISYPPDTNTYVCVSGGKKINYFLKQHIPEKQLVRKGWGSVTSINRFEQYLKYFGLKRQALSSIRTGAEMLSILRFRCDKMNKKKLILYFKSTYRNFESLERYLS